MRPVNQITKAVKKVMNELAVMLHAMTGGHIRPAHITALSLAGHGLVVWALIADRPLKASLLIVVFGLMDALDGALARLQNRASRGGMFFDAVSDRIKEVLIYSGLAVFLDHQGEIGDIWMVVAVCGSSILVSYVKAKGEMAFSDRNIDPQKLNRLFDDGLGRYEVRMAILVVGLALGYLPISLAALLSINSLTAASRFLKISRELSNHNNRVQN